MITAFTCNPTTGRLRQKDQELKTGSSYFARPCLKTTTTNQNQIIIFTYLQVEEDVAKAS
jgi:hypothetical protein